MCEILFFLVLFLSLHEIHLLNSIMDLPLVAGISSGQMECCVRMVGY